MSELPPEVTVIVEPPLPEVSVSVEPPLPEVHVDVHTQGLPGPPGSASDISAHVHSEDPHPEYDDGTSLLLRYENAKA